MSGNTLEGNYTLVLERIKGVTYGLQTCELPAITLSERTISTAPMLDYQTPGEKLIFDKLNISFIVDDNLDNYMEIVDWLWECVNPNKGASRVTERELTSDAMLTVYNKHKVAVRHFRFHDAYPAMLGPLMFSNAGQTNNHITCTLTMSYSHYHNEESTVANVMISENGL
jgi:hypothetical protein